MPCSLIETYRLIHPKLPDGWLLEWAFTSEIGVYAQRCMHLVCIQIKNYGCREAGSLNERTSCLDVFSSGRTDFSLSLAE